MARGYLNSSSFPAQGLEHAKELLGDLRKGISKLVGLNLIEPKILCNLKASQLPLTPEYATLPQIGKAAGPGFRDTLLFFLQTLDQKSPAQDALSPEDQAEAFPSAVDDCDVDFDPDASSVLVSCALDNGVLLSLGTDDRWRSGEVMISMLTANAEITRSQILDNVCNEETSEAVGDRMQARISAHRFDNWDYLTKGASKARQVDEWFMDCRRQSGLEQVLMRAISLACDANWSADGDLVKKLHSGNELAIFEVRAYHQGSNNVRLLFGRNKRGEVAFGYGGQKTSPDWYKHALPQARSFLSLE